MQADMSAAHVYIPAMVLAPSIREPSASVTAPEGFGAYADAFARLRGLKFETIYCRPLCSSRLR